MTQLYAALAGVLLLVGAFFYGEHVQAGLDAARTLKAVAKADAAVVRGDSLTQTRSLAAAIHVQAVQAAADSLRSVIAHTQFSNPSRGDIHADTHRNDAGANTAACNDPFADPHFRVFYDAGSRADAASPKATDLPVAGAGNTGTPASGVRDRSAGG